VRILAISGSLQAASTNTALVRAAATTPPTGVEVTVFERLRDLPHFDPDFDGEPGPAAVADLRAQMAAADGVLIASPEYAHGMPGVLKNALDWLVGSGELYGKPVAVLCGSPRPEGGTNARESIERTLRAEGAVVVASVTVPMPRSSDGTPRPPDGPALRLVDDALLAVSRRAFASRETEPIRTQVG